MAMRWMTAGAAMLVLAACMETVEIGSPPGGGGSRPAGGTRAGGGSTPAGGSAGVQEMARLVNAHRQARGCPALVWLEGAAQAAQAHSADMARRGYFDHVTPEGRQPWDRLAARGVAYRAVAENIAWTPEQSAAQTLRGWINSPGHRQNLENCAYTHHGIGMRSAYWTHVFVTPAPARP
ncbi:MAG TPA: CAP domain-containing protein [Longimicrobium sp.]